MRTPLDIIKSILSGVQKRARAAWYGLGNQVECPLCGWHGSRFLPFGAERTPNRLCPRCGSVERYRMLHSLLTLDPIFNQRNLRLLEVSKKTCFGTFCRSLTNVQYVSCDLKGTGATVHTDLTMAGFSDNAFDIIVCLHVLEHILDDIQAFRELRRILKPQGFGIIMVPLKREITFEDPLVRPDEYERIYGQHDHVRVYGMDIVQRMEKAGLKVQIIDMFMILDTLTIKRQALSGDDRYFFRIEK